MREARAVVVAERYQENLRFVLEAAERVAVNNPVAVAHKIGTEIARLLVHGTPAAHIGAAGVFA